VAGALLYDARLIKRGRVGIEPIAAVFYGVFNTDRKRGDFAEATNTIASLRRRQKAT